MKIKYLTATTLLFVSISLFAQNLPSLLTGKNINATFSITAFDPITREWGIAVATNNIYVGNSTIYIEPGVGAFSVIAETEPLYGINGLKNLKQGASIERSILMTKEKDTSPGLRQVAGIDKEGNVFAFTGSGLRYWKGMAAHRTGENYVVMGNQLAPAVLETMAVAFEQSKGSLAQRLLKSLRAGEKAGGQISGKQSAALVVKGSNHEWFNQIDLRVDHAADPFAGLQTLLNYHDGRIMINQAVYAIGKGNRIRGQELLLQAEKQTKGWYGIYSKTAKAWLLLGQETKAMSLIKEAIRAEPKWKENLPAFYCLYKHPALRTLYPEKNFSVTDWNNAATMLLDLNRAAEAVVLLKKTALKYPTHSYTWYLLARAQKEKGDLGACKAANTKALELDPENEDARQMKKYFLK